MYAYVIDGVVREESGSLPASARRLDTGEWVMGLDTAPDDLLHATGWWEVIDTPRPDDTETTTHDRTVEVVDGQPTVVWVARPWTADELAAEEAAANTTQLVAESDESVDKLVAVVEALNALTALTNADINANPAAIIKDLARECKTIARQANREARLTSGRTESTDTGDVVDT